MNRSVGAEALVGIIQLRSAVLVATGQGVVLH